jgi:hypothetical protein
MAFIPEQPDTDTPRARFVRWRNLIGDEEVARRLRCSEHTVESLCKPHESMSRRKPGLELSFRIEEETAKDRSIAHQHGFSLPIRAREIAGGWG